MVGDVELGLRRQQRALDALAAGSGVSSVARSRNAAGRREAAAAAGPVGGAQHVGGHRLVGAGGRVRGVPGAPVGIGDGVGRLGQGAMHRAAVARGGPAVDRRAHQRMLEAHAEAELDQTGGLGRPAGVARRSRAAPPRATAARGRRPARRPPRSSSSCVSAAATARAAGTSARCGSASGRASGSPNPPASSAGVSPRGSSSSASGLPRVSATIRSRTRSSKPPEDGRGQQRAGVRVGEPSDPQLREPGERVRLGGLADGEHDRDPLGQQPPGDEREHQRGGPVEPLRIVDHAHERADLGRLGQQAQHRDGDQEAIRGSHRAAGRTPPAARPAGAPAARPSPSSSGAHR